LPNKAVIRSQRDQDRENRRRVTHKKKNDNCEINGVHRETENQPAEWHEQMKRGFAEKRNKTPPEEKTRIEETRTFDMVLTTVF